MNRTKNGTVTATARDKFGDKSGKYPIFDEKSALSAIKLRHHGEGVAAGSVLARASRWATTNNSQRVKDAVRKAREVDRS